MEGGKGSLFVLFVAFFAEEMEGKARVALVCPYASRAGWCQRHNTGLDGYSMATLMCPMDWGRGMHLSMRTHLLSLTCECYSRW